MSVDDVRYAADTRRPYRFLVDTTRFAGGRHELSFQATDTAGFASAPESIDVVFESADTAGELTVTFASSRNGATAGKSTTIEAEVSGSNGLSEAQWFVDSELALRVPVSGTQSRISYTWRAGDAEPGAHLITLRIIDAKGQTRAANLQLVVR